jgi:hypothetical protein
VEHSARLDGRLRLSDLAGGALAGRPAHRRLGRLPCRPRSPAADRGPLRREQPDFEAAIYTLDVILPVVNLHRRDAWIAHGLVQWLALACTVVGWVLTTAVMLSLTGILKRE